MMDNDMLKVIATKKEINVNLKKQNTTKNTVKVSALWYFVDWYLEMLNFTGAINDDEFKSIYNQLLKCVHGKIAVPQAKNVLDEYVMYEIET